jgi:hypothetical protein
VGWFSVYNGRFLLGKKVVEKRKRVVSGLSEMKKGTVYPMLVLSCYLSFPLFASRLFVTNFAKRNKARLGYACIPL